MSHSLQDLIRRVGRRLFFARLARRAQQGWLIGVMLGLAVIVAARLLNLFPAPPAWWWPVSLLVPVVIVGATARRPAEERIVRLLDAHTGSRDLFLNAVLTARAGHGGFAAVVTAQAADKAATIEPAGIVPYGWKPGVRNAVAALLALAAAVAWLPQLDPFGQQAVRDQQEQTRQQLTTLQQATTTRREEITEARAAETAAVQQALTRLEETFQKARPQQKEAALQELAARQKELGELWRQLKETDLQANLENTAQRFGEAQPERLQEWRQQMQQGDTRGVREAMNALQKEARELATRPDSAETRAARDQLARRISELAQGLKELTSSPAATAALQQALSQLGVARQSELARQAMEGAAESLQLGTEELEKLAQALRDSKALEEALRNLQLARQLADMGKLDGAECQGLQGMAAYSELFAAKLGEGGRQAGPPSREAPLGPGQGNGALRPEDDSVTTGFKPEKSPTRITAGRMLLEWKTQEVGESGARDESMRAAVREVQQGVAEAIQQERVPPGYHETIKRYFDTLPRP